MSVGVSRSGAGCCRSPVYRPLRTFHSSSPRSWWAAQPLPDSTGASPTVDSELGHNLIKTKQIINSLLINIWAKGESVRLTNLNNSEVRTKKSKYNLNVWLQKRASMRTDNRYTYRGRKPLLTCFGSWGDRWRHCCVRMVWNKNLKRWTSSFWFNFWMFHSITFNLEYIHLGFKFRKVNVDTSELLETSKRN